jgi:hypothetical protein
MKIMRNHFAMVPYVFSLATIILNPGVGWSSTIEVVSPTSDESINEALTFPTPVREDRVWDLPKGAGWEKRFFDKPLSSYNLPKGQFGAPKGSGIPLKSPGILPGIEFRVEMHSFQALQSIVPPESLSNSFGSEQNQPLLLPPSNISPDYNAGFLRFSW